MEQNYSNKDGKSPIKRGRMADVIKPKRPRIRKEHTNSRRDLIVALYIDLVQVLAEHGIELSKVYTIASALSKRGWIRQYTIEDPKDKI